MSFENDISQIKKLVEADDVVFKPAGYRQLYARAAGHKKQLISFLQKQIEKGPPWRGTQSGVCPFCGGDGIEWTERYDDEAFQANYYKCPTCGAVVREQSDIEYKESSVDKYPLGYDPAGQENENEL